MVCYISGKYAFPDFERSKKITMRIAIDLTSLADNFSGIERYAMSIAKELIFYFLKGKSTRHFSSTRVGKILFLKSSRGRISCYLPKCGCPSTSMG